MMWYLTATALILFGGYVVVVTATSILDSEPRSPNVCRNCNILLSASELTLCTFCQGEEEEETVMNINKQLEDNDELIFSSNYPATAASVLLCNDLGYNYDLAKITFIRYCTEHYKLYNIENF